jgi:signal transduction histidine kinase
MNTSVKKETNRFSFRGLSIQQRLPLLICILLLCIIVTFSLMSYVGVKRAALAMGRERLMSLTEQLSTLFGKSAQGFITATHVAATQESIRETLSSGTVESKANAFQTLEKLRLDSSSVLVELLDSNRKQVLLSSKSNIERRINFDSLLQVAFPVTDTANIGKIYLIKDSMYYPVIARVTDKQQVIGYVVRWRLMQSNSKALEQFSQLLGTNASINIGNADGSLWTDLVKPVIGPPLDTMNGRNSLGYSRLDGKPVIASLKPIANTPWVILIEFSEQKVLEAAGRFLKWLIIIGAVLIAAGIFIAWIMSRNITRPLNKLTAAASKIAGGDYSLSVEVNRSDETGKLAHAFNIMAGQVHHSQQALEQKVQDRTSQLQEVNKELEAFSYSVSHDLRAPLRAINSYAMILKEEYGSKLDDEANRLTGKIVDNAKMMAQLIDDLISFSKIGGQELIHNVVDMKKLAESCTNELLQLEPEKKYEVHIDNLPACYGDHNLIKQVWMNLVSNAIKYSSKESAPCIEIGCEEATTMNTYFIKDNGVGFDMQHAHKLFGVFQRLHSQRMFEGTGIGLAFTKRIISKHNGDIRAEASPGKGAVFYFSLPVVPLRKTGETKRTTGLSVAINNL